MNISKKLVALGLSTIMVFALSACGGGGGGSSSSTSSESDGSSSGSSTPTTETSSSGGTGSVSSSVTSAKYVVFAWNDLGMHCANPTYDTAVILPPYNNLYVQVVQRGNPPTVVTTGLTVSYKITNNTYSYGKTDSLGAKFGQFWDYVLQLFGVSLTKDTGLNLVDSNIHNGLSGNMTSKTDHFEADGIPVTPVDNSGVWNPYQVAEITVTDSTGSVVAQTKATIPVSDEINCGKCHGSDPFNDMLSKHDSMHGTSLMSSKPVLCANCHGSPALGQSGAGSSGKYLSYAIHHSHATRGATCYDCHPGATTQCSRSTAHTASDGNCTTCHGDLSNVASTIAAGRVPWASEPACYTCHAVSGVDTGSALYRNSKGHGNLYCSACHGSPHAMVPSNQSSDNYQAIQYQGKAKTIGSCGACHSSSKGEGTAEFSEAHGGANPEHYNACHICHTQVSTNTANWPHSYGWTAR